MTPGANDEPESHEGCAMSYMGKCSAFLPTDKPDNLIEEVGHIESVQVCQHICKELYPDWCTWFIYDRTTNDCKVFSGSIDSFREDCQELGYQKQEKICKLHTDLVATRVCDMVHGTPEPDFQA